MKSIIVMGNKEEIADLVIALQGQQSEKFVIDSDLLVKAICDIGREVQ